MYIYIHIYICDIDLAPCKRSIDGIRLVTKAYEYNNLIMVDYKNLEWENELVCNGHKNLIEFIETIHDCFLHHHISEATRHRENEESNLLDLILTSEEGMVYNLTCQPPLGDHICLSSHCIIANKINSLNQCQTKDFYEMNQHVQAYTILYYNCAS